MISTTTGWAIGRSQLYRTADGGRDWKDVTPSGSVLADGATLGSGPTDPADRVFVLDATTAWVLVGSKGKELVEHTTQGGAAWTAEPLPVQPIGNGTYFRFLNDRDGWMMINGGVALSHMAARVYMTTDGGAAWTEVSFASGTENGGTLPFAGDKNGISLTDPNDVWLGGVSPASGGAYLLRSSDGGRTWAFQTVKAAQTYSQQQFLDAAPEFFGTTTGILALVANGTLLVFTTSNAGATWVMQSSLTSKSTCVTFLTSFANTTDGWVLPHGGCRDASAVAAIEKTADGGATWQTVSSGTNLPSLLPAGSEPEAMGFVDARHGWMLVATMDQEGRLLYTTDGGARWTVIPVRVG